MKHKENLLILIIFGSILLFYVIFQRSGILTKNQTDPIIDSIKERLHVLDPSYTNIPIYVDSEAYTIDKRTIYICIKDPETGQIFSLNTLMYVTLHELAHILTHERHEEHGEEFKKNFAKLLNDAISSGIYDPTQPLPNTYCGVHR